VTSQSHTALQSETDRFGAAAPFLICSGRRPRDADDAPIVSNCLRPSTTSYSPKWSTRRLGSRGSSWAVPVRWTLGRRTPGSLSHDPSAVNSERRLAVWSFRWRKARFTDGSTPRRPARA